MKVSSHATPPPLASPPPQKKTTQKTAMVLAEDFGKRWITIR
jgi:hypothetical protein